MGRRMPKSLQSWLIPILRKASLRWPGKAIARDQAKRYVNAGSFKNGKPRTKVKFQCAKCKNLFNKEETQMDHRAPVIAVSGFQDWNTFMPRLFCPPNAYDCLCLVCHARKTASENRQRDNLTFSKNRANLKKDKYARRNKKFYHRRKRRRHKGPPSTGFGSGPTVG